MQVLQALERRRRDSNPRTTNPPLTAGFKTAGVKRVTLHEARHSFASYLAASGIGIKDLTVISGHSSVTVSLDRYGHLFEARKAQTAAQINAWLEAADTHSRLPPVV